MKTNTYAVALTANNATERTPNGETIAFDTLWIHDVPEHVADQHQGIEVLDQSGPEDRWSLAIKVTPSEDSRAYVDALEARRFVVDTHDSDDVDNWTVTY